jgi:hypothetical protein
MAKLHHLLHLHHLHMTHSRETLHNNLPVNNSITMHPKEPSHVTSATNFKAKEQRPHLVLINHPAWIADRINRDEVRTTPTNRLIPEPFKESIFILHLFDDS